MLPKCTDVAGIKRFSFLHIKAYLYDEPVIKQSTAKRYAGTFGTL